MVFIPGLPSPELVTHPLAPQDCAAFPSFLLSPITASSRAEGVMTPSAVQEAFLSRVRRYVPLAEARGVPGAVLVAQAVSESNWGRSGLARSAAALFGIKATPAWRGAVYCGTTREWIRGTGWVLRRGTHRVYPSLPEATAAGCLPGALFRAHPPTPAHPRH